MLLFEDEGARCSCLNAHVATIRELWKMGRVGSPGTSARRGGNRGMDEEMLSIVFGAR